MARSRGIGDGRIVLTLTEREAMALRYATGNSMEDVDFFPDGRDHAAAVRALAAIEAAVRQNRQEATTC